MSFRNPSSKSSQNSGDLSAKKWSKNGHNSAEIVPKTDAILIPTSRHNAVKLATTRRVVCRPNPERISPKKDKKISSTSRENRKRLSSLSQAELNQVGSIIKFLEVKNNAVKSDEIDGESNPEKLC